MNEPKTHWKKVVSDPNFIGEGDFQEGEEKVLTIDHVNASETVTTAEGKSKKAVLHWREKGVKPMILNVARSKSIEKVAGSGYFEDWPGVQIQLYIEHGIKAFGEVVSAVRVRPFRPRVQKQEPVPPCTDCGDPIEPAMGKDAAGWPPTLQRTTVFPCALPAPRSGRMPKGPLRKRSRMVEMLQKCSTENLPARIRRRS